MPASSCNVAGECKELLRGLGQGAAHSLPAEINVNYKSDCFRKTCLSEFLQLKRGMNVIKQSSYLVSKKYPQT